MDSGFFSGTADAWHTASRPVREGSHRRREGMEPSGWTALLNSLNLTWAGKEICDFTIVPLVPSMMPGV